MGAAGGFFANAHETYQDGDYRRGQVALIAELGVLREHTSSAETF